MATRREEVRVTADVSNFTTRMAAAARSADSFANRLEAADGRMAAIVQTGLALAPALAPIGAAAVPAVAGLTTQLGFAALAAGTTVLAFQGVGDGLKALNDYQLKPTAENFAKLQEKLDGLGPAGQEFVLALDKMTPQFERVQAVAQQGMLPGVTEGLQDVIRLMPEVERVVFAVSTTMGDIARDAGSNLADPRWQGFFNYLQATARPILTEMGQTFGNVVEGIANMVMAFDPLSRDFSTGLLDMSRAFREWSEDLGQSQGFRDFVGYIEKSGPAAMDALGSIANALVQLVEAAAPVGLAVLPVIEALGDALAAIADSAVGPVLISTAAAVGVLGRSLAILETVGLRGGDGGGFLARNYVKPAKGAVAAFRDVRTASDELRVAEERRAQTALKARDAQFALLPDKSKRAAVTEFSTALKQQEAASKRVADAERTRSAAIRQTAATAGKAAAGATGLVIATSGLADNIGLSNTASLALMGTLAGPWGTAIGGGVGLVMDLASANNTLEQSFDALQRAASNPIGLTAMSSQLQQTRKDFEDATSTSHGFLQDALMGLSSIGSDLDEKTQGKIQATTKQLMAMRQSLAQVYASMNQGDISLLTAPLADVEAFAARIAPALQRAGISWDEFAAAPSKATPAIRAYFNEMDSATGKSKAVGDALRALGDEMESNVTQAGMLKSALDSLFGVELSQSEATDAWTQNLKELKGAIADTNGAINGTSDAALKNRESIRGSVEALQAKVNADAAAGVSGGKLVNTLVNGRKAIIDQAVAAGANRGKVAAYLRTLGLTPKNLTTIINTPGLLTAQQKVQALTKAYNLTPKQVKTIVSEAGANPSRAKVQALARQYNLTPKQVRTLLSATDAASAKAKTAKNNIDKVRDKSVSIRAIDAASAAAAAAQAAINRVQGRTVYIRTIHMDERLDRSANGSLWDGSVRAFASGGFAMDSGAYVPRVPQIRQGGGNILWSEPETGWEAYISGKPGMTERNLEIWRQAGERLGARFIEYANGGITAYANGGSNGDGGAARRRRENDREDRRHKSAVAGARRELERFRNSLERNRDSLQKLRQTQTEYRRTIRQTFTHDIFGNGVSGLRTQLQADRNDAKAMLNALKWADRRGLSGGLEKELIASGDLQTAQQISRMKPYQIAQLEKMYAQRAGATSALAQFGGREVYGAQVAAQTRVVRRLDRSVDRLEARLKHIGKHVENGARKGVRDRDRKTNQRRRARR